MKTHFNEIIEELNSTTFFAFLNLMETIKKLKRRCYFIAFMKQLFRNCGFGHI